METLKKNQGEIKMEKKNTTRQLKDLKSRMNQEERIQS